MKKPSGNLVRICGLLIAAQLLLPMALAEEKDTEIPVSETEENEGDPKGALLGAPNCGDVVCQCFRQGRDRREQLPVRTDYLGERKAARADPNVDDYEPPPPPQPRPRLRAATRLQSRTAQDELSRPAEANLGHSLYDPYPSPYNPRYQYPNVERYLLCRNLSPYA